MSTERILIDAAVIAVEYELRILRRDYSLDTESLRFDLASPCRYRDALDTLERDYDIEVVTPMALMELLHGSAESAREPQRIAA